MPKREGSASEGSTHRAGQRSHSGGRRCSSQWNCTFSRHCRHGCAPGQTRVVPGWRNPQCAAFGPAGDGTREEGAAGRSSSSSSKRQELPRGKRTRQNEVVQCSAMQRSRNAFVSSCRPVGCSTVVWVHVCRGAHPATWARDALVGSWAATMRVDSADAVQARWAHRGRRPAPRNLLALFWREANTGGTATRTAQTTQSESCRRVWAQEVRCQGRCCIRHAQQQQRRRYQQKGHDEGCCDSHCNLLGDTASVCAALNRVGNFILAAPRMAAPNAPQRRPLV